MKLLPYRLLVTSLGGASILVFAVGPDAFTLTGESLSTAQRHVRVFDNFSNPRSNNNTTPDANFPGYTGVELAVWKAVTEWGSELHAGNGDGDPSQPGDLGSGGANFDSVWQGNATDVGGVNDNVVSEITGGGGGISSFIETPSSDGWRMRLYSDVPWDDGPGTNITGFDIQGIVTHEYGHALGLGHTVVNGATMFASISGNGVAQRSIESDDAGGVQSVYGAAAISKPHVTGVHDNAGQLVIHGFGFAPVSNEVWFCPNTPTPGSSGVPVKLIGVPSTSNASLITVTIPAAAGPGDVFVKLPAPGNATLSNGWPIDPGNIPPAPGTAYCFGDGSLPTPCPCTPPNTVPSPSGGPDAGCANSFNPAGARLDAAGAKNPDQVILTASGLTPVGFVIFLSGDGNDAAGVANGDGVRCAGGSFVRFGSQNASNGAAKFPNPALGLTNALSIVSSVTPGAGATRYYQCFYRNVAAGWCNAATTNMSSAYQITWN